MTCVVLQNFIISTGGGFIEDIAEEFWLPDDTLNANLAAPPPSDGDAPPDESGDAAEGGEENSDSQQKFTDLF